MDEKERWSQGDLWKSSSLGPQLGIMRLHKDWDQLLGPIMSEQVKLVRIEPPTIFVEVPHAMWKQEVQMKNPALLQVLELYYGKSIIKHIQVRIVGDDFHKDVYVNEEEPLEEAHSVENIQLKEELVQRIEDSLAAVKHEKLKEVLRQARLGQAKKYFALTQEGKRICPHCHVWLEKDQVCSICHEKEREQKRQRIRIILEEHPYFKYDEVHRVDPSITMDEYLSVNKEWIHYYLDRIYKGSLLDHDMYQLAMFILKQKKEEITKEHVVNLTNKYRKKNQQMKVKV